MKNDPKIYEKSPKKKKRNFTQENEKNPKNVRKNDPKIKTKIHPKKLKSPNFLHFVPTLETIMSLVRNDHFPCTK